MIDRQYSSYCFLASELSIEKKIKYSKQAANSQSMGLAEIVKKNNMAVIVFRNQNRQNEIQPN
jgi:hypothetical protein